MRQDINSFKQNKDKLATAVFNEPVVKHSSKRYKYIYRKYIKYNKSHVG